MEEVRKMFEQWEADFSEAQEAKAAKKAQKAEEKLALRKEESH